jgi:hypothetical protein
MWVFGGKWASGSWGALLAGTYRTKEPKGFFSALFTPDGIIDDLKHIKRSLTNHRPEELITNLIGKYENIKRIEEKRREDI